MTKVTLTGASLGRIGDAISSDFSFDFAALDRLSSLDAALTGTVRALQISATIVRMEWTAAQGATPWQVEVSAYRIGPIARLSNLSEAMDQALASHWITHLAYRQEGEVLFDIAFALNGWLVTSGSQSVTLFGDLPDTFAEVGAMRGLILKAGDFDTMDAAARLDWLNALAAEGVTGVTLKDADQVRFGFEYGDTRSWMQMGSYRLFLSGHFDGDRPALAMRMMDLLQRLDDQGRLDLSALKGLDLTGLTILDGRGTVLVKATEMGRGGFGLWLDGQRYDEWVSPGRGDRDQVLAGRPGEVASLVTGHGGDDRIYGMEGKDALFGGDGNDTLFGGPGDDLIQGGAGIDRAIFASATPVRVDLRQAGPQDTGLGRDLLVGIEEVTGGSAGDVLHGSRGDNRLEGMEGDDRLEGDWGSDLLLGGAGSDSLVGGPGADTLDGGVGADVLTGGAGADAFVFKASAAGPAIGIDVVTDFTPGSDVLRLTSLDGAGPWVGMTAEEILSRYAYVAPDHVELRFGPGQVIFLAGLTSLDGLAGSILLA